MDPLHQDSAAGWDITATKYERDEAADIAFLRAGGIAQPPQERAPLGDVSGCGHAIHLQCAGGLDTLSLLNLGVERVTGVDISARMIASARRRSDALTANADWRCCDVLDTPSELNGTADLVYAGDGALPWMRDLDAWAAVVARLLRPGGRLHLSEGHPLDWVWDAAAPDYRFDPAQADYFQRDPGTAAVWPQPFIENAGVEAPMHEFQHTLGEVVTAVARAGLRVELLQEHPEQFWERFKAMPEDTLRRLPHSFSLVARKPE